jgi:hypothetical protein
MEFIGALSNHGLRASLTHLARVLACSPARPAKAPAIVYRRSRPGRVLNAVVAVLAAVEHPMSPRQVHAAVEALLDAPVLWGSVKQALAGNTIGKTTGRACFERVGPGRYALSEPAVSAARTLAAPGLTPTPARIGAL